MKQTFSLQPKITQNLRLHQQMLKSLDFLQADTEKLHQIINKLLQSNPFIEGESNFDNAYCHLENISTIPSLKEELYSQLSFVKKSYNKTIMTYLIESLNAHGFLGDTKERYIHDLQISEKTLLYHIQILQSLEPIGVGAIDCIDSIKIQLHHKGYRRAYLVLDRFLTFVLSQDFQAIANKLNITLEETKEIFEHIRACDPFPCRNYQTDATFYITPDVEITVENKEIQIVPYQHTTIILNKELFTLVKNDKAMVEYFNEANFFIENLNKRNQTILMVMDALTKIQRNYFLFHDQLKGCTIQDVAEICHFHPSTISRTMNQKYYLFNNEVFPFKYLLVSKTVSGDSSDAIKKAIVEIIAAENKNKPYSDQEIENKLKDLDLLCSRRTINKYRKQLHIPASSKRKK